MDRSGTKKKESLSTSKTEAFLCVLVRNLFRKYISIKSDRNNAALWTWTSKMSAKEEQE